MSKVLRRPMFKGGSTNMNGIMSGIKDRENYREGSPYGQRITQTYEDIQPALQEIMGTYQKPTGLSDPVTQFLIQGGLDLMTRPSSGNILRDIAQTGKATSPQLFEAIRQQELQKSGLERDIKSAGLGLAGDIVKSEISALGREKRDLVKESVMGKYMEQGLPARVSQRAADFELDEADKLRVKVGGARVPAGSGVVEFDLSNVDEVKANEKFIKDNYDGKFVYDPFEGNYKRIQVIDGQIYFDEFNSIESIVLKTNKADTEQPKVDSSVPDFGMSIEDPIP